MDLTLTPEAESLLNEHLRSGLYSSPGEVLQEALAALKQRDVLRQARLEELRREIALGIEEADRGELAPLDLDAVKTSGRELLARKRNQP